MNTVILTGIVIVLISENIYRLFINNIIFKNHVIGGLYFFEFIKLLVFIGSTSLVCYYLEEQHELLIITIISTLIFYKGLNFFRLTKSRI